MEALLFRLLGCGALLFALWAWHRNEVHEAVEAINAKAVQERREAVAEYVVEMSGRVAALSNALAVKQGEIRTETRTIVERVPAYVSPLSDSRCRVPVGFVQIHDAAFGMPAVPVPVVGLVEADSGVSLSMVGAVVAENGGTCREIRAELEAARAWYRVESEKVAAFNRRIAGR